MFRVEEKEKIADAVEKVLLEINHPEMPKSCPMFMLRVCGKESWSYAVIRPNWAFQDEEPTSNAWNEGVSRKMLE